MKNYFLAGALGLLMVTSCGEDTAQLREGPWIMQMEVGEGKTLPVALEVTGTHPNYTLFISNADEVIEVDEISVDGDSIRIQMPVFEGYIAGTFTGESINGAFIKESLDRSVLVSARHGESERFPVRKSPGVQLGGTWETTFTESDGDTYPAKGIFLQDGSSLEGTFRTTTGDYRYLDGVVDGDSLKLSTFDGAHVFLFEGVVKGDTLNGVFYSGNHSRETFTAVRNESFELPEADSLTYLKPGYEEISFSFPDENGQLVSLSDPQFNDKVVLVQVMGTWCPNCLDESKFLAAYLENNPSEDLEVVALAFEYARTPEAAFRGISRLRSRLGIDYPILLAQYGTSSKTKANEKLPMLNHVLSYPTTIFIDKQGKVRKIHTGFNGPATGEKYTAFKKSFHKTVTELLAE